MQVLVNLPKTVLTKKATREILQQVIASAIPSEKFSVRVLSDKEKVVKS